MNHSLIGTQPTKYTLQECKDGTWVYKDSNVGGAGLLYFYNQSDRHPGQYRVLDENGNEIPSPAQRIKVAQS